MEQNHNLYRDPHPKGNEKLFQWKISTKELGRGAFSTVFVATHKQQHRNVAMKTVPLEKLEEEYIRLSMNEVSLLKEIKSPYVIELIDAFIAKNILHVALELIDGNDLDVRINIMRDRGTIFSERVIWYKFHQICAGLKHLHDKRIIHRDLKPANIFMTSKYQVKIGDLGLSHQFSGKSTMVNTVVGTFYYLSPERSKCEYYGFPADIWSLGCILYELCTFRSPFSGEIRNLFSLRRKIVNPEIIDLPMNEYSEQLCYFMDACLSLKAEERPSAEECYDAALRMYNKFEEMLRDYKKAAAAVKETLVEAEKKRVQEVEAERKHKENVATLEKERAEAQKEKDAKEKAETEAQAQKEKIESERNMEFLKVGAGILGLFFLGIGIKKFR
uniref:non-specific serine/threonine protein kinase n=1 Tax=Panagrolaimus davidi TaxID=227884 RepID=A0A914QI99_9BILA